MNSIIAIVIALTFLLNSTSGKPVQFSASGQINSRQQSLSDCLSAHNVPTKLISSPDWSTFESPYNLRLVYVPAAITLPTTPQQVSDSVTCAAAAGVKVQAKSGGHSYASFSSGGQDGSLIVDLQEFNSISVDSTTFIATVGGGVRLGNMALALYAQGQRALPHGTCPGVGIGGHFTHGGYGHDSRLWGLALDTIVAMDTVLANGTFVHVTSVGYPDLFFALRGAAESIGIVTTFYLQTLPAPSSVINFSVDLSAVLSSASTVASAFLKLQNFVLTSPLVNRNISFGIYTSGSSFSLGGWYFGDQTYFTTTVLPAMLNGFPTATPSIQALGWIDSLVQENNGQPLSEPLSGYNAHDTFYAKSIVSHNAQPLTLAALESFWGYVINKGQSFPSWFSIINLYGGRDSQINVQPIAPSSYADRDALWVFQNYGSAYNGQPYNNATTTFLDNLNYALTSAQPDGNFGGYLNYVDPDLTASEAADLYYGATVYNQLDVIKNAVDPNAVFWNPQAIGNANRSSSSTTSISTTTTSTSSSSTGISTITTSKSPTSSQTSTSPSSSPTPSLKVSTDGKCGPTIGITCLGSSFGQCCSSSGYCGSSSPWCGTGCQVGYGTCDSSPSLVATSSTSQSSTFVSTTSKASSSSPLSTLKSSPDGSCGGTTGYTCIGSSTVGQGQPACCSKYGWCGSSAAYCGTGCQASFGNCS